MNIILCCLPRSRSARCPYLLGVMMTWIIFSIIYFNNTDLTQINPTDMPPVIEIISQPFIEIEEPRAKGQEPKAKSQEPRAKSQEPRAKSQEPRAKGQGPRAIMNTKPFRDDLNRCFEPFYNTTGPLPINESHPIKCDIDGMGKFAIIKDSHKIKIMKSLDAEDYGKEYMIKHSWDFRNKQPDSAEYEFMDIVSRTEKSRSLTASPHPRYPYLAWKRADNSKQSKVEVIIMERLIGRTLGDLFKDIDEHYQSEEALMSFMVRCWKDIQNVRNVLWNYQDGHYAHGDIKSDQLMVTKKGDVQQCHVIDFGMMVSLRDPHWTWKGWILHTFRDPVWFTFMQNQTVGSEYIAKHGNDTVAEKGWRWKSIQWANTLLVDGMVQFLDRTEGGWPKHFQCNPGKCGHFAASNHTMEWCGHKGHVDRLIHRMEGQKRKGTLKNQAFYRLMQTHSLDFEASLKEVNVDCKQIATE